jgi:hypothetical protein
MPRVAFAFALTLCACASTPRLDDASRAWRRGQRADAVATAADMVARVRDDNRLDPLALDRALEATWHWLDTTPVLLPGDSPMVPTDGPEDASRSAVDRALLRDLRATGATRTLRAVRAVMRLGMKRFAGALFEVIWSREPWQADSPALAAHDTATRSLLVKTAALRALEAMTPL